MSAAPCLFLYQTAPPTAAARTRTTPTTMITVEFPSFALSAVVSVLGEPAVVFVLSEPAVVFVLGEPAVVFVLV